MIENIKAAVFDLDGTLIDSMWVWTDIDLEFLGKHGYALPDDLQKDIEGMSFEETAGYFLQRFPLPYTLEELKKIWIEMSWERYLNEVPLKPGVELFLRELKKRNISMAIASSNSIELVEAVLKVHGIRDYFQAVHTCSEVCSGKPCPDIYLLAAKSLGVTPDECLVFEDVPMGLLAGKRAGIKTCAVADTFSESQETEKRQLADYYIHSYEQILDGSYEVL